MLDRTAEPITVTVWPVENERRRAGRLENPSPELIALMRRNGSVKGRTFAFDAPGFSAPVETRRRGRREAASADVIAAVAVASVLGAALFCAVLMFGGL